MDFQDWTTESWKSCLYLRKHQNIKPDLCMWHWQWVREMLLVEGPLFSPCIKVISCCSIILLNDFLRGKEIKIQGRFFFFISSICTLVWSIPRNSPFLVHFHLYYIIVSIIVSEFKITMLWTVCCNSVLSIYLSETLLPWLFLWMGLEEPPTYLACWISWHGF